MRMTPFRGLMLVLFFFPAMVTGQPKAFKIFGEINGEHKDTIYLFYEGNVAQKDSLSAPIKNGRFSFDLKENLPILCRFHFGENTNIQEFYVDEGQTYISLSSQLTEKDTPDSLGGARTYFELADIKGSRTETIKRSFERRKTELEKTNLPEAQKHSEHFTKLQSLVAANPKSKASAYLIAGGLYMMGEAFMLRGKHPFSHSEVNQLAGMLDATLHRSIEWRNLTKLLSRLDMERNRTNGSVFHDVVLKDTSNRDMATRSVTEKYILVDFWASWCQPCRAENVTLKRLYEKYRQKGFEIISVSLEEDINAWKKAILQDGLTWTQLIDETAFHGNLARHYDINSLPFKILLDKERKVIGMDLSKAELEDLLRNLLPD